VVVIATNRSFANVVFTGLTFLLSVLWLL